MNPNVVLSNSVRSELLLLLRRFWWVDCRYIAWLQFWHRFVNHFLIWTIPTSLLPCVISGECRNSAWARLYATREGVLRKTFKTHHPCQQLVPDAMTLPPSYLKRISSLTGSTEQLILSICWQHHSGPVLTRSIKSNIEHVWRTLKKRCQDFFTKKNRKLPIFKQTHRTTTVVATEAW
jgi:hypothetical protein